MNKTSLFFTAFFSGFSLMGYEILGSRILAPYFGTSVYVWGGLIAVFMLGLSVGYTIGGRIADKHNSKIELAFLILISIIFIFSVSFFGKSICSIISRLSFDIKYTALITSVLLFILPSICLGTVSPYLIKLSSPTTESVGKIAGNIYTASTVGGIAGTLITSFYLILLFGTTMGIRLLCSPLLACLMLLLLAPHRKK